MTLKQAETIQFLWMKISTDIYNVMRKIIEQDKLDCISVQSASDMITLFNESTDIDNDAKAVYKKLKASYKKS